MQPTPAGRYVLIVQHVPWEGPGLIGEALAGIPVRTRNVVQELEPSLPAPDALAGLVVMGGPMNADDLAHFPGLAAERRLLAAAVDAELPTLGVCLGAQLLARALGARVERGVAAEIGWAPVATHIDNDPVVGGLAAGSRVFHWHSDAFDLPQGTVQLASTQATPVQAFRAGVAWALQFHLEATLELVMRWLPTKAMRIDASRLLGVDWRARLTVQTVDSVPLLLPVAMTGLGEFAALVQARASE